MEDYKSKDDYLNDLKKSMNDHKWTKTDILTDHAFILNIQCCNYKNYKEHSDIDHSKWEEIMIELAKKIAGKFNSNLAYRFDNEISLLFLIKQSTAEFSNGSIVNLCNRITSYCSILICHYVYTNNIHIAIKNMPYFNTEIYVIDHNSIDTVMVQYLRCKFIECEFACLNHLCTQADINDYVYKNYETKRKLIQQNWDDISGSLKFGHLIKRMKVIL